MSVFDRHSKEYDYWYDKNRFVYLSELKALKKVLPTFGKGLEIGVGTGRFAKPLGITFGLDPSVEMLGIADERGIKTRWGFGEDLPFWHNNFDYVAIIISLCFVNDPVKVLEESFRVLKNNGRIVLGIVDKNSFLGKFYQKKKSIFYKQAKFFGIKDLSKMLVSSGFKKINYYQTVFDLLGNISSIQEPIRGHGKGGFVVISGQKSD